jgi:hypothetical protein
MTINLTLRKALILAGVEVLALVAAFTGGRYSKPTETRVETKVEYRDKIVEVEKKNVNKDIKKRVETKTTTTENPDGTKTTTVTKVEDTTDHSKTTVDKNKTETHEGKSEELKLEKRELPNWRVAGKVGFDIGKLQVASLDLKTNMVYGVELNRRLFSTVWVGAWGMSNKTAGLSLAIEF